MKFKRCGALAATAIILLTTACGSRDTGSDATSTTDGVSAEAKKLLHLDDCDPYEASPGVTDDSIKFGSSFPMSGVYAAEVVHVDAAQAYLSYVNAQGGVKGRSIDVTTRDDGYDPSRTVANVKKALDKDHAFGLFYVAGSPTVLAYYDDTDARCVPNVLVNTTAPEVSDQKEHPWTIGAVPSSATEVAVLAENLKSRDGIKSVAILSQNNATGKGYVDAWKKTLDGTDIKIAKTETYEADDPNVKSQITNLKASGADAFLGGMTGPKCAQAWNGIKSSGWDPLIMVGYGCQSRATLKLSDPGAADGVVSISYLKDPSDPQWADDKGMKLFKEQMAKYAPDVNSDDPYTVDGWTFATLLTEVLKDMDKPTRAKFMWKFQNLNVSTGLLLPGIKFQTAPGDPFLIEALQLSTYDQDAHVWRFLDGDNILPPGETSVTDLNGQTGKFLGR